MGAYVQAFNSFTVSAETIAGDEVKSTKMLLVMAWHNKRLYFIFCLED